VFNQLAVAVQPGHQVFTVTRHGARADDQGMTISSLVFPAADYFPAFCEIIATGF
jgi:hypothetical protein